MPNSEPTRFSQAADGTQALVNAFDDWSNILRTQSIQVAFAVIAANWAAYGGKEQILSNEWAKASMAIAIAFLGLNLLATWQMARLLHKQHDEAESNRNDWQTLFTTYCQTPSLPWPYTQGIQDLGKVIRVLRCWAPMAAAGLFLVSLFV